MRDPLIRLRRRRPQDPRPRGEEKNGRTAETRAADGEPRSHRNSSGPKTAARVSAAARRHRRGNGSGRLTRVSASPIDHLLRTLVASVLAIIPHPAGKSRSRITVDSRGICNRVSLLWKCDSSSPGEIRKYYSFSSTICFRSVFRYLLSSWRLRRIHRVAQVPPAIFPLS